MSNKNNKDLTLELVNIPISSIIYPGYIKSNRDKATLEDVNTIILKDQFV